MDTHIIPYLLFEISSSLINNYKPHGIICMDLFCSFDGHLSHLMFYLLFAIINSDTIKIIFEFASKQFY